MSRRVAMLAFLVLTGACSPSPAPSYRAEAVAPAVVTDPTTTTTTAPPPTTTTEAPTTTTTRPRPATTVSRATVTPTVPRPAARPPAASTGSGACGGDLPPCSVMQRESGGDPTTIGYGQCGTPANPRNCQGKWQIDPDTAESVGYPRNLAAQPEAVQDDAARAILARDGCGAWSTCG